MDINETILKQHIDSAEAKFNICFGILANFKNQKDNVVDILEFQPLLADTLFALMNFYRDLCKAESELIEDKRSIEYVIFKNRIKEIHKYKKIITETIDIGKSLGDSFAWMFFDSNRNELDKHLSHQSTGLFPLGIGGMGEVEFIKNNQNLFGCLAIYHGITSMLRIGDFSLYALGVGVVATGELKSEQNGNKINVKAYISSKVNLNNEDSKIEKLSGIETSYQKERLARQLKEMDCLFEVKKSDFESSLFRDNNIDLISPSSSNAMQFKISHDNTLLTIIVDVGCETLSERLLLQQEESTIEGLDSIKDFAEKIMIKTSSNNQFILGQIDSRIAKGRHPIFWWNLDIDMIKGILFKSISITTVFNPAKLYDYYEQKGFSIIKTSNSYHVEFEKVIEDKKLSIKNTDMYLDMITHSFFPVDSIIELIDGVIEKIESGDVLPDTKVELIIHQHF